MVIKASILVACLVATASAAIDPFASTSRSMRAESGYPTGNRDASSEISMSGKCAGKDSAHEGLLHTKKTRACCKSAKGSVIASKDEGKQALGAKLQQATNQHLDAALENAKASVMNARSGDAKLSSGMGGDEAEYYAILEQMLDGNTDGYEFNTKANATGSCRIEKADGSGTRTEGSIKADITCTGGFVLTEKSDAVDKKSKKGLSNASEMEDLITGSELKALCDSA